MRATEQDIHDCRALDLSEFSLDLGFNLAELRHQAVCGFKLLNLLADLQHKVSNVAIKAEVKIG